MRTTAMGGRCSSCGGSPMTLRDVRIALRACARSVVEHVTLADVARGEPPAGING